MDISDREVTFINESHHMSGIHGHNLKPKKIEIDPYEVIEDKIAEQGYLIAYACCAERAKNRMPLKISDLCQWQKMITLQQRKYGTNIEDDAIGYFKNKEAETNATEILETLNKTLLSLPYPPPFEMISATLGDFCSQWYTLSPFKIGNERMLRLLANYIALWCSQPVIVFREKELGDYNSAKKNPFAFRCYMANKIKEAIGIGGRIYFRDEGYGPEESSAPYTSQEGEKLIMEWHQFNEKMEKWKSGARK